jgi:hypothetical protein
MGRTPFAERRDESGRSRRAAPVIETMTRGYRRLGRNHLKGALGDALPALLAAPATTLRLILRPLAAACDRLRPYLG